jgi:hypothetical protein
MRSLDPSVRQMSDGNLFLPQRAAWVHRAMFSGLPCVPKIGDLGLVKDAVAEIVDAAGGLEYSREEFRRAVTIAQSEFDDRLKGLSQLGQSSVWGGANTPAVYYAFYNAVAWTRSVKERYGDRLYPAVKHDQDIWIALQKIRSRADTVFDDARLLAQCSLHKYAPPYPLAGASIVAGRTLIYQIPRIVDADDWRANLSTLSNDRHAASIVDGFWSTVSCFVEALLDVFYPRTMDVVSDPDEERT